MSLTTCEPVVEKEWYNENVSIPPPTSDGIE